MKNKNVEALAGRTWGRALRAATAAVLLPLLSVLAAAAHAQALPPPDADDGKTFRAIAMHDVRHNVRESFAGEPEPTALDERTVADFFAWLRSAGYQPVSLQQIVDARAGRTPLPPRAVLLSFDDGYVSFYAKVYPLLKQFNYPAVMALVTGWLEVPPGQVVSGYGATNAVRREAFITWDQAREMGASGLVEFASHGDAIHTGVPGNPQGNLQPAAVTHRYDSATGRYEDDAAWIARVEADLRRSRGLIEQRTGTRVRAMVWPYGAYNKAALRAADRAGMPITLTLDEGPNTADVPLQTIRRGLATYDIAVPDFSLLRAPARPDPRALQRAMHIDLDNVYDPDPAQQEANLSRLLDRVQAVGPSAVFLQAFADPDGDGAADALYFPNRHMPMRADLFNRVAWQLRTRTGVEVYAWMPVLAFQLPASSPLADVRVTHLEPASPAARDQVRYHRLSPADPRVRALIGDIYEDLAKNAPVAGLLFHDDATYSDDEDASPAALRELSAQGLPANIATLRADPALRAKWTAFKTRQLTDFTLALAQRAREWQPDILTARNLYARPVLEPASQEWFAQSLAQSLEAYDYTAVMAMPFMEQAADPKAWLEALFRQVAAQPRGLERTVFELQARDWRSGRMVDSATLAGQWTLLHRLGARHVAIYPDDFLEGQPPLVTVRDILSVRANLRGGKVDSLETPPALAPAKPGASR
ncbi:biofilm PGA synthesis lipoprotein PgaB [Variovorax sp. OK605]|uniref:poly-beta-1,6-N-acetyl-D-glucosamine N-deacetylase PgaB n=1 Tax=Variovorax sp. OK605 TaxID=1855317 RepID=UPI0008EB1797|nr:poly-beta-1,6-N-acetyl-D-glucosamine N-deacetylase PgaB [Variovorax sp. OK605]SFP85463.1 biofilm PGA synthesis lipoprotein PgaB [Variovorax sp. OK605]